MARLSKEELEKVKKKYNVDELYSWSKIDCFCRSCYEYYLKYILKKKEDYDNCAYAPLGGFVHNIIERYYGGEIQYKDMIKEFEDGWLTIIDLADLKLDRNDEEKNNSIKEKYKYDLQHFFKHHKRIEDNIALEKFVAAKIGDYVLQGYIDAIVKTKDGDYNIIDWKTSSKSGFSGKKLDEKLGQLTVYGIALIQMGVPINKIHIGFNLLKYCTIQYEQANGQIKTRDVERCEIGEKLQSNAKLWLKKLGYEEEVDDYLKLLLDTNDITCLPQEVQEKYTISDCYMYTPLTQELIDKWTNEITTTIKDIEMREADFKETNSEMCFWDSDESVEKQSYYFATLCGYSANLHKPYAKYLDRLEESKNGNIFGGLGSSLNDSITSKDITIKSTDIDLSWLDNI